ncbi:hypothetical protein [Methanobrevibacter sp.]|uniref:hypothetical protein n=1 Tax=Methanobrevibacter sp. TaxID=66852 RepID=UPI00388E436A
MNAFSATDFTNDSNVALQSSDLVDEVAADAAGEVADDSEDNQADDTQNNDETGTNTEDTNTGDDGTESGAGSSGKTPSFNFNGTSGNYNFSGMNRSSSSNYSNMSIDEILDIFMKLFGGNETNTTNTTDVTNDTVESEVSDVPAVATSTSYAPVSHPTVEKHSQYTITRVRDNKIISQGDTLKLEGINKLYDSDFSNGHLLVYVDGKLVFNELTAGDLATPIFGITDSYLGQHQIKVEFTPDGDSNVNKYTEDVIIS